MKQSDYRRGRDLVRTRKRVPADKVRRGGAHQPAPQYEPEVCSTCNGYGYVDCETRECPDCQGVGEV